MKLLVSVASGFLVVKRFEALYRTFAADPKFDNDIYALPLFGTDPDRRAVKYRGLDREAIAPKVWTPAPNDREAFKQESRALDSHGGVGSPNTLNAIETPGKKYRQEDNEIP